MGFKGKAVSFLNHSLSFVKLLREETITRLDWKVTSAHSRLRSNEDWLTLERFNSMKTRGKPRFAS